MAYAARNPTAVDEHRIVKNRRGPSVRSSPATTILKSLFSSLIGGGLQETQPMQLGTIQTSLLLELEGGSNLHHTPPRFAAQSMASTMHVDDETASQVLRLCTQRPPQ